MANLVFDNFELQKTVIPSIESTIEILSSAIIISNNLNIPSGFMFATTLKELPTYLQTISNNFAYTKDWINSSNSRLENCLEELSNRLQDIGKLEIKSRELIVNVK